MSPLTKVTNKHLLPVYNKPMIYFPIMKMKEMGIKSILIVSGRGHAGHFLELLGSGSELGVSISYEVQEEAGGIAQALSLAEEFACDDKFAVMLGDNVFEDNLNEAVEEFKSSGNEAHVFLKEVKNPKSYGVVKFENEKVVEIQEKPSVPPSNFAVTGFYLYSPAVFNVIRTLKPSARGELEISDVNNYYVKNDKLGNTKLKGFWGDCGESFDSLMEVSRFIQQKS